jgi:hypothetical protein
MGKIIYREFLGNRLVFLLLCLSGIGLPVAVLYLLEWTVTVEENVDSPRVFLDSFRSGRRSAP